MLLELSADNLFSDWFLLIVLFEAANDVTSISLDSLVVQGQSTHKDSELKDEVSDDTQACHQAEVLQGRHISQHSNEES